MARIEKAAALVAIAAALSLVAGVVGVAVAAAHSAVVAAAAAPRDLLPNLVELPPSDVQVATVTTNGAARYELRFTSTAGNNGAGPLLLLASRTGPKARFTAAQLIVLANGATRRLPLSVSIGYIAAPSHNHFHLAGFERYELREPSIGLIARDSKAGYCLGDRAPLGTPAGPARFTDTCGRAAPGTLHLGEGISVGWADPYLASFPGQQFDLTDLPAGTYTLVNRVNDERVFRELSYADNVAATKLRLAWPDGPAGAPRVTVLATCLAERCG